MSATQAVIDCHSDVSIDVYRRRLAGESAVLSRLHAPAYRAGGVVASVCAVGGDLPFGHVPITGRGAYADTVEVLDALEADVQESNGAFAIVTSADEVQTCLNAGVFAIVLAIEGAGPIEGDRGKLADLFERGIRIVGLTWNSRNEIAVGLESGSGGLTDFGVEAIAQMNELGVVIDLPHASPTTFWDVAKVSEAPLYASHSNARAVRDHARNLDDDQLDAVAASKGAVGLVSYSDFVAPPPVAVGDLLHHIDHFRRAVGDECIVIGADFLDYALEETAANARDSPSYNELPTYFPTGLESVAEMQNLIRAMAAHGLPAATISQVARENFLRLLAATQGGLK